MTDIMELYNRIEALLPKDGSVCLSQSNGVIMVEPDKTMVTCEECSEAFHTGQHTGRRSSSKYCSTKCRQKAWRDDR